MLCGPFVHDDEVCCERRVDRDYDLRRFHPVVAAVVDATRGQQGQGSDEQDGEGLAHGWVLRGNI